VVQSLFDGSITTKWLDMGAGGPGGQGWVEYRLLASQPPVSLAGYDVISAEDCPERDPVEWVLECWPEPSNARSGALGDSSGDTAATGTSAATAGAEGRAEGRAEGWTEVDRRTDVKFGGRRTMLSFSVQSCPYSRRYRLHILRLANPEGANSVQLACWNLYAAPAIVWDSSRQAQAETHPPSDHLSAAAEAVLLAQRQQQPQPQRSEADGGSAAHPGAREGLLDDHKLGFTEPMTLRQLELLTRIVGNLVNHSGDLKYREVRACKIQELVDSPAAFLVLLGIGFRPLLKPVGVAAMERIPAHPFGELEGRLQEVALRYSPGDEARSAQAITRLLAQLQALASAEAS